MRAFFVDPSSIVRRIWGRADTVLFVFAGAAAEFSLNKAVDWLYYTGKLPADPLGRLFSTVRYAQEIVFSSYEDALSAIDRITAVHRGVEVSRGARIPSAAYLDVLFMLIDYSIRSFELLERRLTRKEKMEVWRVFYRMGKRMGLEGLPHNYDSWVKMRAEYLETNLVLSPFAIDLYLQYRRQLGWARYKLLLQVQALLAPERVGRLLALPVVPVLAPVVPVYKVLRVCRMDGGIRRLLVPVGYRGQVAVLE